MCTSPTMPAHAPCSVQSSIQSHTFNPTVQEKTTKWEEGIDEMEWRMDHWVVHRLTWSYCKLNTRLYEKIASKESITG